MKFIVASFFSILYRNLADKIFWYDMKATYEYPKGELILVGEITDK